ncbi:DUF2523 family protein [Suttonella ornithocola]|uniref:Protein of uncharacterized function (DUF2523) n=2 Tax=Suttonella ornithocola TaxID=279832 RepID=A0A380MVP2_9GAMM|nr:DUF2523 family protein [Suttonella ornithocola]SUO93457.1 Protein of uncharacterised function (DUF2523) [Suttonella ornithocola]SUO96352.1 Protein of uncharacterised function (DUF2523) [Suttonella ornithocola]
MAKLLSVVLVWVLSSVIFRILAALGIGFFTYKGVVNLVDEGIARLQPLLSQLPAAVLDLLAIAGVPEGLSIIVSALATAAAFHAAKVFVGVVT